VRDTKKNKAFALKHPPGMAAVARLAFSPGGKYLAVATEDPGNPAAACAVYLWDTATWKLTWVLPHKDKSCSGLAFDSRGEKLAIASTAYVVHGEKGKVTIWDLPRKKALVSLQEDPGYVESLAWSSDGTYLATGTWNPMKTDKESVALWEAATGKRVATLAD